MFKMWRSGNIYTGLTPKATLETQTRVLVNQHENACHSTADKLFSDGRGCGSLLLEFSQSKGGGKA